MSSSPPLCASLPITELYDHSQTEAVWLLRGLRLKDGTLFDDI